jgi:hypothetical protein
MRILGRIIAVVMVVAGVAIGIARQSIAASCCIRTSGRLSGNPVISRPSRRATKKLKN